MACALAAAACGSGQKSDGRRFSQADRRSAQAALDLLDRTSISRAVVAISYQIQHAPTLCTVLPVDGVRGVFRLIVAWQPTNLPSSSQSQSVLEATIREPSAGNNRFHVSSFGGRLSPEPASVKATLVRAMLARPAEPCEVLENGHLELVSMS